MPAHTHTHTHFQVQGLEKGVSENEAPGPVGAYTTTHNITPTLVPNINKLNSNVARASCRGSAGRLRLPKTHPNTRTYGATKSSYVHAYIRKDGKWRKKVLKARIKNTWITEYEAGKIPNYRKVSRRPCHSSMKCVTYKNAIRTNPGGSYAHMRTHERERERERQRAREM